MLLPKTRFTKDVIFFTVSMAVCTLFSAALVVLFTPGVMVNDDIAMMAFSNGDFTGQSESQLVFIGAAIGVFLKFLYDFNSSMPWYPLVLVAIQILASATIVTAFYKFSEKRITKELAAVIAIIISLMPVLVLDISFSTTAMFAAVAGVISAGLILESRENFGFGFVVLVLLTLVIAGSLRFDFLLAAGVLLLPYFIVRFKKTSLREILLATMFLVIPLGSHYGENSLSTSDEWTEYRHFNQLRGSMHGTPAFARFVDTSYEEETVEQIREFGWESEDLLLFGNWYFENSKLYNNESLSQLREKLDITPTSLPIQASLENVFYGREWFVIVCALIVFLGMMSGTRQAKQLFGVQIIWFVLGAMYISSRYRFPDRFAMSAIAGLFLGLVASSSILSHRALTTRAPLPRRTLAVHAAILGCGLFVSTLVFPHKFSAIEISKRNIDQSKHLQAELKIINEVSERGRVVFIGAQIESEGINPWTDRTLLAGKRFLGLGWATGSPHQELRKTEMDLDGDFLTRLAEGMDNHIITNQAIADLLKYSYERRHGRNLELKPMKDLTYGTIFGISIDPDKAVDIYRRTSPD